jgi:hypothetical protein
MFGSKFTPVSGKKIVKGVVTAAVALAMLPGLTACDEGEVATALGAAAIVAGAVAIGAAGNGSGYHNGYRCEGGYRDVCSSYRDYYGNYRNECRRDWDSCAYRRPYRYAGNAQDFEQGYSEEDVQPYAWAETFDMGLENSEKLIHAFQEARNGNAKPAKDLGFKGEDAQRISEHKMPKDESIRRIAGKLDLDVETTREMLETLIEYAPQE